MYLYTTTYWIKLGEMENSKHRNGLELVPFAFGTKSVHAPDLAKQRNCQKLQKVSNSPYKNQINQSNTLYL